MMEGGREGSFGHFHYDVISERPPSKVRKLFPSLLALYKQADDVSIGKSDELWCLVLDNTAERRTCAFLFAIKTIKCLLHDSTSNLSKTLAAGSDVLQSVCSLCHLLRVSSCSFQAHQIQQVQR